MAPSRNLPSSTISSTRPISRLALAGTCWPLVIISSAFCTRRCGAALGAAGRGSNPKFTSGRPQRAEGHGDAVVGAQGHFQPAAQGGAVDGGDHRLGGAFHGVLDVEQAGPGLGRHRTR